jgi:predicted secreted protein
MGDTAQIVAWTAAIFTGVGGLAGGLATAWVMVRKAKAEIDMGERKQEDVVAAEAYALFKDAMTARVAALEKTLEIVTEKLEKSREAEKKCEIAMAELKGDFKLMAERLDRLMSHDNANKEQIEQSRREAAVIKEAVKEIDPTAKLP